MVDLIVGAFVFAVIVMLAWGAFALLWPIIAAVFWIFVAGLASGGIFVLIAIVVIVVLFN